MSVLVDKTILFLCILFLVVPGKFSTEELVAMLLSIAAASLVTYFNQDRSRLLILLIWMIAVICIPGFVLFLPMAGYDIWKKKDWFVWGLMALALLLAPGQYTTYTCLKLLFFMGVAVWLSWQTREKKTLLQKLIMTRDNDMELNIALRNKNKVMQENRENEILVATLSERNRIAREIHDTVGHLLSSSLLQVGAMIAVTTESEKKQQLTNIKDTLGEAMTSIRDSVHNLRDESFDLHWAIRSAMKGLEQYQIQLDYDVESEMPSELKYCFAAMVKEALSNTVRHSDADKIHIVVREHPVFYQIIIEDNGKSKGKTSVDGMGLASMKERIENLGGTLFFQKENGFRIFASVPKKEKE